MKPRIPKFTDDRERLGFVRLADERGSHITDIGAKLITEVPEIYDRFKIEGGTTSPKAGDVWASELHDLRHSPSGAIRAGRYLLADEVMVRPKPKTEDKLRVVGEIESCYDLDSLMDQVTQVYDVPICAGFGWKGGTDEEYIAVAVETVKRLYELARTSTDSKKLKFARRRLAAVAGRKPCEKAFYPGGGSPIGYSFSLPGVIDLAKIAYEHLDREEGDLAVTSARDGLVSIQPSSRRRRGMPELATDKERVQYVLTGDISDLLLSDYGAKMLTGVPEMLEAFHAKGGRGIPKAGDLFCVTIHDPSEWERREPFVSDPRRVYDTITKRPTWRQKARAISEMHDSAILGKIIEDMSYDSKSFPSKADSSSFEEAHYITGGERSKLAMAAIERCYELAYSGDKAAASTIVRAYCLPTGSKPRDIRTEETEPYEVFPEVRDACIHYLKALAKEPKSLETLKSVTKDAIEEARRSLGIVDPVAMGHSGITRIFSEERGGRAIEFARLD